MLPTSFLLAALSCVVLADAASFDLPTSLATKSVYWDQAKDPRRSVTTLPAKEEDQYTLVQVQNIVRHGTRYPTKGNTVEIEELLAKLQTSYASVLPAWLQGYTLPYNVSIEGMLAATGTAETQAFGARARKSIGEAVPAAYSADKFLVQHTYKPRTKDTARAFIDTFFSNPSDVVYVEKPKTSDKLFRFFDECPRYTRDVADNASATIELTEYKAAPAFQKNVASLRAALNLPETANLTTLDVESAFSACAFDLALYRTKDNWCSLLSEEFIKSLEFADELDVFVENSAGFKISYEISAVLLQDIYQYFVDFTQNKTAIVGNLRFVHAETVLPLLTLLGYVDKTPLTATFTPEQIENRKFRSSRLAPFMANIEFRLYTKHAATSKTDCKSDLTRESSSKYYVQIRVNEQIAPVPGCDDEVFCELSEVAKIWDYYLTKYDFDEDCKI